MSIAFSSVPENFRVDDLILEKHQRLFEQRGLNERHYDIVLEHFEGTLKDLGVDQQVVAEARAVVAGLRAVFKQGADDAAARKRVEQSRRRALLVAAAIGVVAFAASRYVRRSSSRR